jgi:16S rRNA U1498 N3-methylase RsmE
MRNTYRFILIEALKECITEPGARCMQEGLGRQKRRLEEINKIAVAALKQCDPETAKIFKQLEALNERTK